MNTERTLPFLVTVVLILAAIPAAAQSTGDGRGVPHGETMREYMASLEKSGYLKDQMNLVEHRVAQAQAENEALSATWKAEAEAALAEVASADGPRPHFTKEARERYDRGASIGDLISNLFELHKQYLTHYFSGCSTWPIGVRLTGVCIKIKLFPPRVEVDPRWDYHIPVQVMEASEQPFASSLIPKIAMKPLVGLSNSILNMMARPLFTAEFIDFNARSTLKTWGISLPTGVGHGFRNYKDQFKFELDELYRFAPAPSMGYRNFEYHLMNSYFEEIWSFLGAGQWCHHRHNKLIPWMSEAPWGILFSRFPVTTYVTKLRDETITPFNATPFGGLGHFCSEQYAAKGGHTPNNIYTATSSFWDIIASPGMQIQGLVNKEYRFKGENTEKFCLPGDSGTRGPFTSWVKQSSAGQAILPAFYRAARGGGTLANMFQGRRAWYNLQYEKDGDKLRDRFQQNYPKNKLFDGNGCWNKEEKFIPKIYALEHPNVDRNWDDNNVFVASHWKYFRCCRRNDSYYSFIVQWFDPGDMVKE